MKFRSLLVPLVFLLSCAPVAAQDLSQLAPADEYFGTYRISVLGIANMIKDSASRLDGGANPREVIDGPLAFAADAIRDWEHQYPHDYWIPRDLLNLQRVYARVPGNRAHDLTAKTTAWLLRDFPESDQAQMLRDELADTTETPPQASVPASAWERFAALRAPLAPAKP